MKQILAIDPGGTTGLAWWREAATGDAWDLKHIGPDEHHWDLWCFLDRLVSLTHPAELTIVCESFEFRQNRQRDNINLMSKEYIGIVKLFGTNTDTPVVFQTAAMGKGFVSDEKLKAMGLWVPGMKHAMDARRHLITYMVQKQRRIDLTKSWRNL